MNNPNQFLVNKIKIDNKNKDNLFEYISNINKNHVKKYKTILKFLNLNFVFDNSEENNQEKNEQKNSNNSNKLTHSIKSAEIIKEKQIIDNNKREQNIDKQKKDNLSNIKFKSDLKEKQQKYNNIFKFDLYESIDKEEKKVEEINKKDTHIIMDYKDNVNYYENNKTSIKLKKFFIENDDNEQNIDNEDNEIIINENDDLISPRDIYDSNKINSRNKTNNIYSNDSKILLEQTPIINKKSLNFYSYDKRDIPNKHILEPNNKEMNLENRINKEDNSEKEINNNTRKDRINIKKVEQRLFKKNHTINNINLTFVDNNAKKDICTCYIF